MLDFDALWKVVIMSKDSHVPSSTVIEKYWWHVNKTGFPIQESTWKKMWDYVVATHPEGANIAMSICGQVCRKVPIPSPPVISTTYPPKENLLAVQKYMEELQYNHTGTQFFEIKKNRPLSRFANLWLSVSDFLCATNQSYFHKSPAKCLVQWNFTYTDSSYPAALIIRTSKMHQDNDIHRHFGVH